jgi:two-component sensor histidine kinase
MRSFLRGGDVRPAIVSGPVFLEPEVRWRVGLIVTELITNAARHAFIDRGGEIRVEILSYENAVHCQSCARCIAAARRRALDSHCKRLFTGAGWCKKIYDRYRSAVASIANHEKLFG